MTQYNNNDGDLTEEQKKFGRSWLPDEPVFAEFKEDETLVEAIELQCIPCSIKFLHEYDIPKTRDEYKEDKKNWKCNQCNELYLIKPMEQDEKITKRSVYTQEEWCNLLNERYVILKQTVNENLPQLWLAIELVLSVKALLHIKDNNLPLIMILLGAPSSLKTVAIQLLRKLPIAFYTDNFTAKSFVSHTTAVKEEQLRKIDMLPMIKNKLMLAPEMAPLFAKKDDEMIEVLGIITRVADGHGYMSNSGGCGHRGYSGEYMFNMLGAAVDIPKKVYKYLGYLGPKLYFFRLPKHNKTVEDYLQQLQQETFATKLKRIEKSSDYFNLFEMGPLKFDKET
jgi:hypothetical protein